MAAWAIAWVRAPAHFLPTAYANATAQTLQGFVASSVLLGVLTLALLYANIVLIIYHAPTFARPLDIAFIHAPARFMFILTAGLLFPYSLLYVLTLLYICWEKVY
jgi:hypothetical protein